MAALTLPQGAHHHSLQGYLQNVGKAGRAFLAALIAFEFSPGISKTKVSEQAAASVLKDARPDTSMLELYRMASQIGTVTPDLIDELRLLAAREVVRRRRHQ